MSEFFLQSDDYQRMERTPINSSTPCPRKNYNPVYVVITLANNVGF